MTSRFDELSKAMASGMPRRTVLKLFAASLLGSLAAPWTRLAAHAAPAPRVCNPPCGPGQLCITINNRPVCVAAAACNPPCKPGQLCVSTNGGRGRCVPGPCNPPCRPGESCVSFNGNTFICVAHHCNPPCRGDEICVAMNGSPVCVRRP